MTHSHKLVNSVLKCFEMQKYISYHDLKKKKLKWIYPFDEPNFSGNRYWPLYNTNGQYHPLVKKVKSWIFTSSVTLDKEIKKFYNVKRRLVLQRFLIIYCVEKKKWISSCHFPIDYANELFKTYMQQNQKLQ